jgi:predicted RNA-binding protein with PIN domain
MTTHSINVPDAWQIHTANGRYEETMFEFQFESPASTALSVRLVGQSSTEHDAIYTITVVIDDGEEQSMIAGECTSEAEAMKTTEELLRSLQRSFRAESRTLDELDAETLEAIVGRYRFGTLRYRIRAILDSFQNLREND